MSGSNELVGADLSRGIAEAELGEGMMIEGHVDGEPVLVARSGGELFAVGGRCSHYGAPLADGLLAGDSVRCPLHHACFDLRSGDATCAPALDPIATYDVARAAGRIVVTRKRAQPAKPARAKHASAADAPRSIVIVGAGGAGNAAAEMLRRRGYDGRLTMVGAERDLPYDRPNLSKDYLAGKAPESWIPLRSAEFYAEREIELVLGARVTGIDTAARELRSLNGKIPPYDRLLLATGSEVVRLPLVTQNLPNVFYLRTLADSRAIVAAAGSARRVVVVGASFIALEVAAALRERSLLVDVVAPTRPFERVFGPALGQYIEGVHEAHGVTFHFGESVQFVDGNTVTLTSGRKLPADMVVVGIGVRPAIALAQWAKIEIDNGVLVDSYLETSRPGIFAAGDIARWPDRRTGERIRAEHWTVAERQGQTAARNMLGERVAYDDVPFFWSQHYDLMIKYVGHHDTWDEIVVDGDIGARDCRIEYRGRGMLLAVATIGRDRESLRYEAAMRAESAALGAAGGVPAAPLKR